MTVGSVFTPTPVQQNRFRSILTHRLLWRSHFQTSKLAALVQFTAERLRRVQTQHGAQTLDCTGWQRNADSILKGRRCWHHAKSQQLTGCWLTLLSNRSFTWNTTDLSRIFAQYLGWPHGSSPYYRPTWGVAFYSNFTLLSPTVTACQCVWLLLLPRTA